MANRIGAVDHGEVRIADEVMGPIRWDNIPLPNPNQRFPGDILREMGRHPPAVQPRPLAGRAVVVDRAVPMEIDDGNDPMVID